MSEQKTRTYKKNDRVESMVDCHLHNESVNKGGLGTVLDVSGVEGFYKVQWDEQDHPVTVPQNRIKPATEKTKEETMTIEERTLTYTELAAKLVQIAACFCTETQEDYSKGTNSQKLEDLFTPALLLDHDIYKQIHTVWFSSRMSDKKHTALTLSLLAEHITNNYSDEELEEDCSSRSRGSEEVDNFLTSQLCTECEQFECALTDDSEDTVYTDDDCVHVVRDNVRYVFENPSHWSEARCEKYYAGLVDRLS